MSTDNAIEWLEENEFYRWRLFNSTGGKVQEFEHDSDTEKAQQALELLRKTFRLMAPGKYVLKGWVGKNRNASQSEFNFTKTAEPANNHMSQQAENNSLENVYNKGYQEAERYLRLEYRIKAIEDAVTAMKTELTSIHKQLTDDDKGNDGDALERLGKMAGMAPDLANALSAFKSL